MPPRYAYWTIIVDDQPTAFRSGSQEELLPTFKRLKAKNDTAVMMWFQNGKLWPSRVDAQEAMIARGALGRRGEERQSGMGFRDRDRRPTRDRAERTAWTPRGEPSTPPAPRNAGDKLDWKPKGEFVPAPKRSEKPDWKPKGSLDRDSKPDWKSRTPRPQDLRTSHSAKPEWKPKGSFTPAPRRSQNPDWKSDRESKPEWKPKGSFDRDRKPSSRGSFDREERPRSFKRPDFKPSGDETRSARPEWKPKGSFVPAPKRSENRESFKPRSEKPEWKPKGSFDKPSEGRSFDRERKTEWKPKSEWKPKGSFDRDRKPEWKPTRDSGGRFSAPDRDRAPRTGKLDWKPKTEASLRSPIPDPRSPIPDPRSPEKRKWVPKEEYKKSMGIEAKRDSKWRPGGEHKDPRQKYKDAKKAKWTKFKQNIRARSGGKGKKSS